MCTRVLGRGVRRCTSADASPPLEKLQALEHSIIIHRRVMHELLLTCAPAWCPTMNASSTSKKQRQLQGDDAPGPVAEAVSTAITKGAAWADMTTGML